MEVSSKALYVAFFAGVVVASLLGAALVAPARNCLVTERGAELRHAGGKPVPLDEPVVSRH